MKKGKYLLLLLCVPLILTGCKNTPKLENGEEVIVEVTDKQFTADDFFDKLKEKYGASVLVSLVDDYITSKELTEDMIKSAEEEAQSNYDMYYAYYSSNWQSFLSYYGYNSNDEFLNELKNNAKQQAVLEKYLKENVITEDEIKEYYEKNIYGENTVRHILIKPDTTDSMSDTEKTEAKKKALEEANSIIETLKKSNDLENDFISIAKEKSDDTQTKSEGGLIENFTNESGLVTEFWESSLNLKVGEFTTTPVETDYGYHIIYKVSQNDKPSLDSVRDKVISSVIEELLSSDNASYVYWAGLREKYGMTIYDDTIKDTYKATMDNLKKNN